MNEGAVRILHIHSSFSLGGKEARAVRLMNLWRTRAYHSIVSADPEAMGARQAIDADVRCAFPIDAPSLRGRPSLRRYRRWADYMRGFDLVLTYNWGAMDAVMAHRLFSSMLRLPPLIHHEDGFSEDEAERLKPQRNLFRRIALGRAHALVVPSRRLHQVARTAWRQPEGRVHLIPNGVDVEAYGRPPAAGAIPGFVPEPGTVVVGTLAGLRAVKNLTLLARAVARLGGGVRLVIVGEGPERESIMEQARGLGFDRLLLTGFLPEPWKYVGLFDIFALSSDSEQCPISLIEAMAAGLPVASTDVGDVAMMVADENRPFIVRAGDDTALTAAIERLVRNRALRQRLGAANRQKAMACYREGDMVTRYAALYDQAMAWPGALTT